MEFVQPIREKGKIKAMKQVLLKHGRRNYMMFVIGINTGLRISDILQLKAADVRNKTHITIREIKTGKPRKFLINDALRQELDQYIQDMNDWQYLFTSRKGNNKPISRVQAYRILNDAAASIGLEEVGTHTLRKTFGYWHYKQYKDVAVLQDIFNHTAPLITLRYIGINQDIKDQTISEFHL